MRLFKQLAMVRRLTPKPVEKLSLRVGGTTGTLEGSFTPQSAASLIGAQDTEGMKAFMGRLY